MPKQKPHKHHSNKKLVYIHQNFGGGYEQWAAQQGNIKREQKLAYKERQKKGH